MKRQAIFFFLALTPMFNIAQDLDWAEQFISKIDRSTVFYDTCLKKRLLIFSGYKIMKIVF